MTAADTRNPPHRTGLERVRSYEYTLVPITTAEERIAREREEIETEARALGQFAERVEAASPTAEPSGPIGIATVQRQQSAGGRIQSLREAYRETMMAVPHYERVYDEPLRANAAAELGRDVANGLCSGDTELTPQLKGALYGAANAARRRREEYLDTLRAEAESLDDSRSALSDVAESLSSCSDRGDQSASTIGEAVEQIDRVVVERQEALHRRTNSNTNGHDLYAYLLDGDSWTYPVLYAAASLRQEAEALRRYLA